MFFCNPKVVCHPLRRQTKDEKTLKATCHASRVCAALVSTGLGDFGAYWWCYVWDVVLDCCLQVKKWLIGSYLPILLPAYKEQSIYLLLFWNSTEKKKSLSLVCLCSNANIASLWSSAASHLVCSLKALLFVVLASRDSCLYLHPLVMVTDSRRKWSCLLCCFDRCLLQLAVK